MAKGKTINGTIFGDGGQGTIFPGLVGTNDDDLIYGYGGNDYLSGLDGDDLLDGGTGADYMTGGNGSDIYYVDSVLDTVDERNYNGYDRVYSSVSYTLGAGVEELRFLETPVALIGAGNELNNIIVGNSFSNILVGDIGDDTLHGNDGNDILIGDGDDSFVPGSQGAGRDWLYGGADIDQLKGGDGDDHLYGGTHADQLYGGADNDVLDGGTGEDRMWGEGGDDKYYVDNVADQVIEAGLEGRDKVFTSVTFTLSAAVEDLVLLDGSGAINGTGNALNNEIRGNDSNNTLSGLGGDDDFWGFEGEDTIFGGDGEDVILGGTEDDDLRGDRHNDFLRGEEGDDFLSGGADNDTLYGEEGQDELVGGTGIDTMFGGTGNDIYWVQDVGDVVSEVSFENQGVDTAHSLLNDYTLTVNVENLILEGLARNGTGNEASNRINGNGLDNTINGGLGSDFLLGGGGGDTFVFDSSLANGPNIDTIWDFDTALDTIRLDNAVFTALKGDERALAGTEFRVGSAAQDASDRIVYNSSNGALLYDADGVGGQAAIQFAILDPGLGVTAADFWVV